jgi:hypothetical protein
LEILNNLKPGVLPKLVSNEIAWRLIKAKKFLSLKRNNKENCINKTHRKEKLHFIKHLIEKNEKDLKTKATLFRNLEELTTEKASPTEVPDHLLCKISYVSL